MISANTLEWLLSQVTRSYGELDSKERAMFGEAMICLEELKSAQVLSATKESTITIIPPTTFHNNARFSKIAMIKQLRNDFGMSLKEAKAIVDGDAFKSKHIDPESLVRTYEMFGAEVELS